MTTDKLGEALRITGNADPDSLTSQAMAGKRAIHVITSDLPAGPQRTALVAETGAAMQDELMAYRGARAGIETAYLDTTSELDRALEDALAGMDVDALVAAHKEAHPEA